MDLEVTVLAAGALGRTQDKRRSAKEDEGTAPLSLPGSGENIPEELDPRIRRFREIEKDVLAHEAAHAVSAGGMGWPVVYRYATGPDGRRYIVGGHVMISVPKGRTPEEQLRILSRVIGAALANPDPSPGDKAVARWAARAELEALRELQAARRNALEELGLESLLSTFGVEL
jgi:hypothetical protein